MKGEHDQVWHEFALKQWDICPVYSYVTKKVEEEFGLRNMYHAVRSFLYRQTAIYRKRKEMSRLKAARLSAEKRNMPDVKLGMKVKFDPLCGMVAGGHETVTGKVIHIHEDHRWFGVQYKLGDTIQRTSFNFPDIGHTVHICEGAGA